MENKGHCKNLMKKKKRKHDSDSFLAMEPQQGSQQRESKPTFWRKLQFGGWHLRHVPPMLRHQSEPTISRHRVEVSRKEKLVREEDAVLNYLDNIIESAVVIEERNFDSSYEASSADEEIRETKGHFDCEDVILRDLKIDFKDKRSQISYESIKGFDSFMLY